MIPSSFLPFSLSAPLKQSQVKRSQAAVYQKHQLSLTELFSYVQSTGKEQMEYKKVKLHPKSLPETITFSSTHVSLVGRRRVSKQMWAPSQWSKAKTGEVGHSHRHTGTVSTSRLSEEELGESSKLTVKSSLEQVERESEIARHNVFEFLHWQHFSAINKFNLVCCGICPVGGRFP